jgi:hypothetical protein
MAYAAAEPTNPLPMMPILPRFTSFGATCSSWSAGIRLGGDSRGTTGGLAPPVSH